VFEIDERNDGASLSPTAKTLRSKGVPLSEKTPTAVQSK
jgi:hypothetical protein